MQDPLNQRNSHILSLSPAIIYAGRVDEPFYLTFISENLTSRLGFDTKVCLHNPDFWRELIHPDDVECVFDDYVKVSANDFHKHEYRLRKEDGEYLWVLDELRLVRDASGRPLEVIGSWLDITDRKETERALQQSERLFRVFFKAIRLQRSFPQQMVLSIWSTRHLLNIQISRRKKLLAVRRRSSVSGESPRIVSVWLRLFRSLAS